MICAPPGACTVSRLSLAPAASIEPAIRTTGKGCIRVTAGELTAIVSAATLERPFASVTRSRTMWLPGVEKVVLSAGGPTLSAPLPVSAQANPVIGLLAPVEVDTSETGSPVCGAEGNH